jgi:HD-like signal output (HDOD) protein
MVELNSFETLLLQCRRASSLPPLPSSVLRLIREIEENDPSTAQLERIITSDPALTTAFLRLHRMDVGATDEIGTHIQSVILTIGFRAVKNIALSLLVQNSLKGAFEECLFDPKACARHSLFVAYLAHYVAARPFATDPHRPQDIGDVFAFGVLHDLSVYLLAKLSPATYNRVQFYARKRQSSIAAAFQHLYNRPLTDLGATACEAWRLPQAFVRFQQGCNEPWMARELEHAVCSILYADQVANQYGWAFESWTVRDDLPSELIEELVIPEAELVLVVERVGQLVEAFCPPNPNYSERLVGAGAG